MQFATQHQKNATQVQKCIAIFNIKIMLLRCTFYTNFFKAGIFCYAKF